jgi:hypothetical protein
MTLWKFLDLKIIIFEILVWDYDTMHNEKILIKFWKSYNKYVF